MDVTLEELRQLRATLTSHRLQHETLVTQMQLLRQTCSELRHQMAAAGAQRRSMRAEPSQQHRSAAG
ncbi:MAG: hypothetical protein AAGJ46_08810 [Planctomycetota bacterium]